MERTQRSFLKRNWESDDFGYTLERYEGMFQIKIYKYQPDK